MTTLATAAGVPRRLAFAVDMTFVGTGVASFDYADYSSLLPLRDTPLIVYNKGFTKAKYVFSNEMLRLYIQRFGERNVVGVGAGAADDDSFRRLLWSENVTDLHVIVGGWPDRKAPGHPVVPRRFHAGLLKRVRVHVLRIFDSSRPINAGSNKASHAATTWAKVSLATSPALEYVSSGFQPASCAQESGGSRRCSTLPLMKASTEGPHIRISSWQGPFQYASGASCRA